jgi:hypothetical protein
MYPPQVPVSGEGGRPARRARHLAWHICANGAFRSSWIAFQFSPGEGFFRSRNGVSEVAFFGASGL